MVKTNIIKTDVLDELSDTYKELERVFESFQPNQVDVIPFEGSWTAGQVAEHLLKSDVSSLLYGNTKETERRPDEEVGQIKKSFLNFSIKMKNPDSNTPTNTKHNKKVMLTSLKETGEKIKQAAGTLDLTETCLDFELPGGGGKLTRLEWIYFNIFHTQRHTHQLKNILNKLNNN